jgi:hypothetical protein
MSLLDRFEGKWKWAFHPCFFVWFAGGGGIGMQWLRILFEIKAPISTWLAAFGAFMACCGVTTIGRPVIRVGGYRTWYKNSLTIGGGSYQPTREEKAETLQRLKDAIAVQITGPALVIVGTMINGLSGFV